jgi:uncharacterized membrane protein HdeD (DUF308 family)
MKTDPAPASETPVLHELEQLREHWLLLLILGIGLVVVGAMAIISSFIATLATVTFFGTLLFVGGVLELVNAVTCRNWRGFFVYLLIGILFTVVGLIMMNHPLAAAAGLTLMLAAAFMVGGAIRIIAAAVEHFHGWPWVMVNGFITLFLGIYIWRHFPEAAFWVIGLFVGIDLIFCGWSWIMLAIGIRSAFPAKA